MLPSLIPLVGLIEDARWQEIASALATPAHSALAGTRLDDRLAGAIHRPAANWPAVGDVFDPDSEALVFDVAHTVTRPGWSVKT